MNRLTQGMSALALVTSLGLVMPNTFGGSVSADPVLGNGRTEDPRWFYCDVDANPDTAAIPFHVVSQGNDYGSFHDLNSSTILAYSYDITVEVNDPFSATNPPPAAPDGRAGEVTTKTDPPRQNGKGNHNGKFAQAVACHEAPEGQPNAYTYVEDITACCKPLVKDVQYRVFGDRTWYVTLTGNGQGSTNSSSGKHHHHSHQHRH